MRRYSCLTHAGSLSSFRYMGGKIGCDQRVFRVLCWLVGGWGLLALAPACGSVHQGGTPPDDPGGSLDAGPRDAGAGPMPDGPAGDAGVDAPPGPPYPFPTNPAGGEFAWVVSMPGAGDPVSVTADHDGRIVVVAKQTGEVTFGELHVPSPETREALLVLKLTADGKPIWARSFDGATQINPSAVATTPEGDIVVGGSFQGTGLRVGDVAVANAGNMDGFVMVLDGQSGATRWAAPLGSPADDRVAGVVAGHDGAGADAIYVYGNLSQSAMIAGQAVASGAYLIRYDADGTPRWVNAYPNLAPDFANAIALDPQHGPVITGTFGGTLVLGDQVAVDGAGDTVVAGFDPDGHARFARPIYAGSTSSFYRSLALAPSGDIYVASNASYGTTLVDDHPIWAPGLPSQILLLRLTPEGRYAFSTLIAGDPIPHVQHMATDATGAAYMITSCPTRVYVQPEIECPQGGSVILSYDADNQYRWATYVRPGLVESMVAVPGNRLIVAGVSAWYGDDEDFGGVRVPTQQLFIAALAGGPARAPSPVPAAPVISGVQLDGQFDTELRQGGTATLVVRGHGLDHVTSARLGDIDIHVPPSAGTEPVLRLTVTIPHGHAPGPLSLVLGNAGGTASATSVVNVTPVVVTPLGSDSGRGTFSSPMRLRRVDWIDLLDYGDVLLLRNGVHTCNTGIQLRTGVIVHGESKSGTLVRGDLGRPFGGFHMGGGHFGAASVENMTIESAGFYDGAISVASNGRVNVTDVDLRGASEIGIRASSGGTAIVRRVRYLQGSGTAIFVDGGRVDASQVEIAGHATGISVHAGALNLADSTVSSDATAVLLGNGTSTSEVTDTTITRSTLRSSYRGIDAITARLTVRDSTIEAINPGPNGMDGINMVGGDLTVTGSVIRGWPNVGINTFWLATDIIIFASASPGPRASALDPTPEATTVTLDDVEVTACRFGIRYDAGLGGGRFAMHRSRVSSTDTGVLIERTFEAADLGTASVPGDNQLEVTSGGAALEVFGDSPGVAVGAHGTTLNGLSYAGDVQGPADVAGGYRIGAASTVHF
jgi:hypothetical protein